MMIRHQVVFEEEVVAVEAVVEMVAEELKFLADRQEDMMVLQEHREVLFREVVVVVVGVEVIMVAVVDSHTMDAVLEVVGEEDQDIFIQLYLLMHQQLLEVVLLEMDLLELIYFLQLKLQLSLHQEQKLQTLRLVQILLD